jgi:hypothetical protein
MEDKFCRNVVKKDDELVRGRNMGKRLSKIYTKTGDAGQTGLGDGSRIEKERK